MAEQGCGKVAETARSVAAHFRFSAVGIVIAHAHRTAFSLGGLHGNQAVRADAEAAVAQGFYGFLVQHGREAFVAVVHHDKVIAGARHFIEMK